MKDFLNTYIENNKENILKDLSDLIAIPSVSADKDKVAEALEFTLKLGEKMGFRSINCLDGQVGVIEAGDGPETLGILAHVVWYRKETLRTGTQTHSKQLSLTEKCTAEVRWMIKEWLLLHCTE